MIIFVATRCPCGWQEYDDKCYLVTTGKPATQAEAQQHCNNMSAKLASIQSPRINEFFKL